MKNSYDINQEPIVISKITSDIFLKQEHPADLMALYWFCNLLAEKKSGFSYSYSHIAKSLKWDEDKARRIMKILIQLGLIDEK